MEGIKEGVQDTKIVREVLRIIKPGNFQDMLINKDDIDKLKVFAINVELIPFDGWVPIMTNLPGNEDPSLAISVPFLVTSLSMERPLIGFNVVEQIVRDSYSD